MLVLPYDYSMSTKRKRTAKQIKKSHQRIVRLLAIYTAILLLTATVAAALAIRSKHTSADTSTPKNSSPFSAAQINVVPFSLYYPTDLPDGLHIDQSSINLADANIITMRIIDETSAPTSRTVTISQQALPAGFNTTAFNEGMENKSTVETDYGVATLGTINLGQTKLATLTTKDNTLLLVQADSGLSVDDLTQILRHLKSVTRR